MPHSDPIAISALASVSMLTGAIATPLASAEMAMGSLCGMILRPTTVPIAITPLPASDSRTPMILTVAPPTMRSGKNTSTTPSNATALPPTSNTGWRGG